MISGIIQKIMYRSTRDGYSVIEVASPEGDYTLVGYFDIIREGCLIEAECKNEVHPVYGEQFFVHSHIIKEPDSPAGIKAYLASGAIKGIGEVLADRIVKKFKEDTFRIIEEEPERLSEIKGISENIALSISAQFSSEKDIRQAMIFLHKHGVGTKTAVKIYNFYKNEIYDIISQNPYKIAEDIKGVSFKTVDAIAVSSGIASDSTYRIKSAVEYILSKALQSGHTYLPVETLLKNIYELTDLDCISAESHFAGMQMENRIVIKNLNGCSCVYLSRIYHMESNMALMLHDINSAGSFRADIKAKETGKETETDTDKTEETKAKKITGKKAGSGEVDLKTEKEISDIESETGIVLDRLQRQAVYGAYCHRLLVITGGPGTGKTTVINSIIKLFEKKGLEFLLAAPTGRAAKRMSEACDHEAKTIHRLLEINVAGADKTDNDDIYEDMYFEKNENEPLEADAVIIDEVSMVDIYLMYALLKAVTPGTRLILVGDVNQLPSVGPGNILKDIINSQCFHTIRLNNIYRQLEKSDIVTNAHKIINSAYIELKRKSRDFLFIERHGSEAVISAMITLITKKLPDYIAADMLQIQVLTPMRRGELGSVRLNSLLQRYLNPPSDDKNEKKTVDCIFREGDKIIQIKNNYRLEWRIYSKDGRIVEKGSGVYNGDIGTISRIDEFSEVLCVEFDDKKTVDYNFDMLDEIEHAYALTIHKSQGSEYPAVIIPVFNAAALLMTRNILYTGVTRARKCVVMVGENKYFYEMAANNSEIKRCSGLEIMLRQYCMLRENTD